ncbi:MAG TPA: hypothetical protein VGD78_10800, partial [Chthoniobacterales bacterium]
ALEDKLPYRRSHRDTRPYPRPRQAAPAAKELAAPPNKARPNQRSPAGQNGKRLGINAYGSLILRPRATSPFVLPQQHPSWAGWEEAKAWGQALDWEGWETASRAVAGAKGATGPEEQVKAAAVPGQGLAMAKGLGPGW